MLAIAASGAGWAQEPPTLRFAFPSAPQSMLWRAWYGPWVDRVLADAEGSIKIQPYFGSTLATMLNSYDRAVSGVADIATGVSNSMTGKLRGSTVVELPSDVPSRVASGAMWRLYERGLISAEWSEVRPLMFFIYPASTPHFVQPVERLEQLKGMKIATVSKADSDAYRLLGAAPITAAVNQLYEMLNRQVASGLVIGWAALQTF
jgi:TRAP-type C4-dicarboxylate transport system substrate-binding protein